MDWEKRPKCLYATSQMKQCIYVIQRKGQMLLFSKGHIEQRWTVLFDLGKCNTTCKSSILDWEGCPSLVYQTDVSTDKAEQDGTTLPGNNKSKMILIKSQNV